MQTVSATPAYGRDYKSKKAVLDDWKAGKDFEFFSVLGIAGKGSIHETDFLKEKGIEAIQFRYKKQTETFIHKI